MKKRTVGKFKTHILRAVAPVVRTEKSPILFPGGGDRPIQGQLSSALTFEKDIVVPLGESEWNACR